MFSVKTIILKYKLYIGVVFLVLFSSCKEEQKSLLPDPTDISMRYDLPEIAFVEQTAVAERATAEWSVFEEFKSNLASLSDVDLERMRSQTEKLSSYSDSLINNIPRSLASLPIINRMDVVNARIELLQQTADSWAVDSLELKTNYKELLVAFNILLHQVNEKFNKEAIQMQEEDNFNHELQQQTRDSIFKLEKSRQKR